MTIAHDMQSKRLTDIMCLIEHDDTILAHLFRHLFGNFRVQQIVERVNHYITECELHCNISLGLICRHEKALDSPFVEW